MIAIDRKNNRGEYLYCFDALKKTFCIFGVKTYTQVEKKNTFAAKLNINKMKNYYLAIILLLLAAGCNQNGQQPTVVTDTAFATQIDSLEYIAKTGTQKEKMEAYSFLIKYYDSKSNDSITKQYAYELVRLAHKEKNRKMEAIGYTFLGSAYNNIIKHDSALLCYQKALELREEENDREQIMRSKTRVANTLMIMRKYDEALKINLECLEYFTETDNKQAIFVVLHSIAGGYGDMDLYDLSIEYYLKALTVLESMEEKPFTNQYKGHGFVNIGNTLIRKNEHAEALDYLEKGLTLFKKENTDYYIGKALTMRHECYLALNKTEEALRDLEEVEVIANKLNNNILKYEVHMAKGKIYMDRKQYQQAFDCFKRVLALLEVSKNSHFLYATCQRLAEASAFAGTPLETYEYIGKFAGLAKDAFTEEWSSKMTEMKVRYETEKKELKIAALEERQRLITWLSISAGVMLLLSLTAFFFLWRWTVQKRQLAETRILQLEKEKQLIATQSLLDGETQERSRLARDLHDGLGSILVGAKLNLLEMKKGAMLEYDSLQRYENTVGLIERSMNEMRRVAHHLMPEALTAAGLKQSAADFIDSIPHATFNYYGDE